VGVVESAAREHDDLIGRRVVGEINVGCRKCPFCALGIKEHCASRTVLGIRGRPGAFAEYLSLPAANLHIVPESLPDETAVFVEPTAAALRIGEQVPVHRSTRAAVVGDGRLGLLVGQALSAQGADVTVVGRHPAKLELARRLGLATIPGESPEPGPREFDLVVDATGRSDGLAAALDLVRPCGVVVLKTTCHGDSTVALSRVVVDEVTIVGSRCGPFAPAIRALVDARIQTAPLVERTYPLEEFEAAFEAARTGLKVLLRAEP
jgi:threonine dehydrogenase-like Zn-dependent dehydrogenase